MEDDVRALAETHRAAVEGLRAMVDRIEEDQWILPTPNNAWDVRALVAHLVSGTLWVVPLLAGETVEQVGDRFDGDVLGDDPKARFRDASEAAAAACLEPGALARTVHVSSGPVPAAEYILERIADAGMHTWDLGKALGLEVRLDPAVVRSGRRLLNEKGDLWRQYGALGPVVPTEPGADEQTLFIAGSGRDPSWPG